MVKKKEVDEEKIKKEKETKKQEKILKNVLIGIGVLFLIVVFFYLVLYSTTNFGYEGIKFKIIKEGKLVFYNTAFALVNQDGERVGDYNFFIRNDPRELGELVPFNGTLFIADDAVLNFSENLSCGGDEIIAIANLQKPFQVMGVNVIRDEKADCDVFGRYMYINIAEGDETKVEQFGPACYNVTFKDCEILEATERLMLEIFVRLNEED
jgi:hypothetical protein